MTDIKLIASDMDNTLLTTKGQLPPDIKPIISDLAALNIEFTIASGRSLYTLADIFPDRRNQMILVADNGAAISYHGEVIFKSLLETATYQELIRFIIEETDGVPILCDLEAAIIEEKDAEHLDFLRTFYSRIKTVEKLDMVVTDANKLTVYFPHKDSKIFYEEIFKPRYDADLSVTVGDTMWIDIMNKGIDKGTALAFIGQYLNISTEQMMAFGDTYNDVEMLQAVKYSYVVDNASDDMKQYAKFIAKSNDEHGVTEVIQQVIDQKGHI